MLAGLCAAAACSSAPPAPPAAPATLAAPALPAASPLRTDQPATASVAAHVPPRMTVSRIRTADGSGVTVAVFRGSVQYVLHHGGQDPGPAYAALVRAGPVVVGTERRRLLAAFNGGFLLRSRAGGYEQEGHVFRLAATAWPAWIEPPRPPEACRRPDRGPGGGTAQDWAEKTSTDLARRFNVIRVEDLQIRNMTRSARGTRENPGRNVRAKATLNRAILRSGWGLLVRRLEEEAPAGWT